MLYLVQRQRVAVSWCDGDGGAEGQPASAAEVKPTHENREGDGRFQEENYTFISSAVDQRTWKWKLDPAPPP